MLGNHIKIAIRSLRRHRTFSGINLLGLTLGTTCCLYILLFVNGHYGYDTHHRGADRLFRITGELHIPGEAEPILTALSSPPIALAAQEEFPEVLVATRATLPLGVDQQLLEVGDYRVYHQPGYYVDSTFFEVFDYHFIAGNPATALDEPFSVVITTDLAEQLYGRTNVIGESIAISDSNERALFTVGGVFDHSLGKTHLESDLFLSMNSTGLGQFIRSNNSWGGNNFLLSYLKLRAGGDPAELEKKLAGFLERNGGEQMEAMGMKKNLYLQSVSDIHTSDTFSNDMAGNTSGAFLRILLLIAGFIQLIACINFINLTTARASRRAQEVGVRKVVGAGNNSLLSQFLVESLALAVIAVVLALPLTKLLLPFLNNLTGASVALQLNVFTVSIIFGLAILTGLLAGIYPAIMLSSFKPVQVLKGGTFKGGRSWVRQALVVGQMVVAAGLIMVAILIHNQVNYLLDKDLGFEAEQKLVFNLYGIDNQQQIPAFKQAMERLSSVEQVSAMGQPPGQNMVRDQLLFKDGETTEEGHLTLLSYVDQNYLSTLKIDLVAGRHFTISDTVSERGIHKIIVNEATLRSQQIPIEDAIGTVLYADWAGEMVENTIIGVIKDFNYQSLNNEMMPVMLISEVARELNYLIADVNTTDYADFLAKAEATWAEYVPELPFRYSFLDEDIAQLYETEQTLSSIISTFTILAIVIACLGLFGLSVFAAEQRQKEISIRKVLGASLVSLVSLLSKEFVLLVAFALVLATPIAYYVMNQWLANFAYQTPIDWWIFGLTAIMAIGLALLTISFQSIKAALVNPADRLRGE